MEESSRLNSSIFRWFRRVGAATAAARIGAMAFEEDAESEICSRGLWGGAAVSSAFRRDHSDSTTKRSNAARKARLMT
jgi:hypothetical protein